jgi:hypothetical protein
MGRKQIVFSKNWRVSCPFGDTPLPVPSNIGFNHPSLSIYYSLENYIIWVTFPLHTSYSCDPERGPSFSTSPFHIFPLACTGLRFFSSSQGSHWLHSFQPTYIIKPQSILWHVDPIKASCSSEMSMLTISRTQSKLYTIPQLINYA